MNNEKKEKPQIGSPIISIKIDLGEVKKMLNVKELTEQNIILLASLDSGPAKAINDALTFALEGLDEAEEDEKNKIIGELKSASILNVDAWACKSCGEWWYHKCVNGHCYCPRC